MIECTVNGHRVWPVLEQNIKVTYNNPSYGKTDAFTMEIVFPLSIPANLAVFGHVNRIEVSRSKATFAACRLCVGGVLVISGKGTVTRYTESEVRMQIKDGSRNSGYGEGADAFIDEVLNIPVTWPELNSRMLLEQYTGHEDLDNAVKAYPANSLRDDGCLPLFTDKRAILLPIHDKTSDVTRNNLAALYELDDTTFGWYMYDAAPQVRLMTAIDFAWRYLGVQSVTNHYDREPWSQLYIANVRKTSSAGEALPHWTVRTLLDEFSRLFNCRYVLSLDGSSVDILPRLSGTDIDSESPVTLEPVDEFAAECDDDGTENVGASNLAYSDIPESSSVDITPDDVLKAYKTAEFATDTAATTTLANAQSPWYQFYGGPGGLYYASNEKNAMVSGRFNPLIRDAQSESTVELRIVPVALARRDWAADVYRRLSADSQYYKKVGSVSAISVSMPVIEGSNHEVARLCDVLDGEDEPLGPKEEDKLLQVFFLGNPEFNRAGNRRDMGVYMPFPYTDGRNGYVMYRPSSGQPGNGSLALARTEGSVAVGQFHSEGRSVENRVQHVFRFLFDGKPDPARLYMFRNKVYECQKIEVNVTDTGLDRLMTGYFYEML